MEAAADLFARQGFSATSMSEVAAAAGSSKETLYSYFGDKSGLLREVLTALVPLAPPEGRIASAAGSATDPEAVVDRLNELAHWLIDELMNPSYLALARIVIAESPRDPSLAQLFRSAIADRAFAAVIAVVRGGVAEGRLPPGIDESTLARGFVGPLLTYVLLDGLLAPPSRVRQPDAHAVRGAVAFFATALMAHLKEESR